jgi:hypothetical protein
MRKTKDKPDNTKVYYRDEDGNYVPFTGKTEIGKAAKAVAYNAATDKPVYRKVDENSWEDIAKSIQK